ncbi:MAG: HNH endonuclease [Proteobacteria bacterium]|nr:HNH endonuclease [Pseudomonadota bacterium]
MIRKQKEYEKARQLRQSGMRIDDIAKEVGATHGTICIWCKDIKLITPNRKPRAKCRVCGKSASGHQLCHKHLCRFKKYGTTELPKKETKYCEVAGCVNPARQKGLCNMHRLRLRDFGDVGISQPKKNKKGQGHISASTGYRYFYRPSHPNAGKNGTVAEHIVVMSEVLGRALLPKETVHHKNGVKLDNRPENLELWSIAHPTGQRVVDMVAFCHTYLLEHKKEYTQWLAEH